MNARKRTLRGRSVKFFLFCSALAAVTSLVSCSGEFTERAYRDQLQAGQPGTDVRVTFSGISTLLVEDGTTQILIDGYFSRTPHIPLITRIEPDLAEIRNATKVLNLKEFSCATGGRLANCPDAQHRGLSWVIPVHAHYDHAMDSAIVAAKFNSRLIADTSVARLIEPSKRLLEKSASPGFWNPAGLNWDIQLMHPPIEDSYPPVTFSTGDFRISIFRTPHIETAIHRLFGKDETPPGFAFPAGIFEMGEGTSFSVHISHGDRSMLIIGSAGDLEDQLSTAKDIIGDTDVVFLGIGGLGFKKDTRADLLLSIASTTQAKRIIPIHWDSHVQQLFGQPPPQSNPKLEAFRPNRLNATLRTLEEFEQQHETTDIVFAPVLQPFDPFQDLD